MEHEVIAPASPLSDSAITYLMASKTTDMPS
jgi:hypothetical protein